jgi:predicted lipoprotein with Yx(FWY)xxD motif
MTLPPRGTRTHRRPSGSSKSEVRTVRNLARTLGSALAVAVFMSLVLSSPVAGASSATVDEAVNATFGMVLINAEGFTLYTLPSDHNGISSCTGLCASVWPALTVPSETTPTEGPGVPGMVSAVLQPDGADQVTYNGSPLYTFVGDSSPGQATGNGVGGFKVAQVSTTMGVCEGTEVQCISSSPSAAATVGTAFTFPVTAIGSPTPTIKGKGKLPKGVKFHMGTGTAAISGTPTSTKHKSAVGTYHLTITAIFGKGKTKQLVTQSFTLTVS